MDNETLFNKLVQAEDEDDVEEILKKAGLLHDEAWLPLGAIPNNFAVAGNQHGDPSGAAVEKIINAIDAVLMREAFMRGINPEGAEAPRNMRDAVEQFFGVRQGQINSLTATQQTVLAENIQMVAVGSKTNPSYLIIDQGEGQTPASFPATFLSIVSENKMRIPFVQGRYNSGGLGTLQFCGKLNFQLIVSRRHPNAPIRPGDETGDLWGFTLVRRLRPTTAGGRKNSMYVYLAPGGQIPAFKADGIKVLPSKSSSNKPALPYAFDLPYGTCIKLYNYRWKPKTLITLNARYELERFLPSPALPFRVTDTRDYTANYYSTTVAGGWNTAITEDTDGESKKLEDGFPSYGDMSLDHIGTLPYRIAVFKEVKRDRSIPSGVHFLVNGQVHGSLPSDYVRRQLKFDYLSGEKGPLYVLLDCTGMEDHVREDFFMASRDRLRKDETYNTIEAKLTEELRDHPGLQALNQQRRQKEQEKFLGDEGPLDAFESIIKADPSLASLFGGGDHLVTGTGPGPQLPFNGQKFPSFFRLAKEPKGGGLVKGCPINKTCRVEFETDAHNDYFIRLYDPGEVTIEPTDLLEHNHLWNGQWETRFRVPWDAKPGDMIPVTVTVTDVQRTVPFVSTFTLRAEPEAPEVSHTSGRSNGHRQPTPNSNQTGVALSPPRPIEVRREDWEKFGFTKFDALCVRNSPEGGYDYYLNVDNTFLLTEQSQAKAEDKPLVKFWFKWGLVIAAVGMIKHSKRLAAVSVESGNRNGYEDGDDEEREEDLNAVGHYCSGLAQVIVPIIRTLSRTPVAPVG